MNNQRTCIASNKKQDKSKMIRIVLTKENKFYVDSDKLGRGAYISRDPMYVNVLVKKKLLNRVFRMQVDATIYNILVEKIKGVTDGEDKKDK